jgi:tRNA(Ile2) C34 agmatinyltransferase TiaS
MQQKVQELICRKGHSYFGSGGFSAGWKVVEGEIEAFQIAGTYDDNGFRRVWKYLLKPKTPYAVVRVWDGDGISTSGYRPLGKNGIYVLVQDEEVEVPPLCPECGHRMEKKDGREICLHCKSIILD